MLPRRIGERVMQSIGLRLVLWLGLVTTCLALQNTAWLGESVRYIVIFQGGIPSTTQTERAASVARYGGAITHRLPLVNAVAIQLPATQAAVALDRLRRYEEVKGIVIDAAVGLRSRVHDEGVAGEGGEQVLITSATPAAVTGGYTWNLLHIFLHEADPEVEGEDVGVAVLDTGIDFLHPVLTVVGGYNARAGEDPTAYMDRNGHGTHMAGIIAAELEDDVTSGAMRGIAPEAALYAVRVLDDAGGGFLSDVINGLSWVYQHPEIRVVNMSLGFYKEAPYPLLEQIIQLLYDAGVVIVAAAGNYRADCIPPSVAAGEGGEGSGGAGEGGETGSGSSTASACNTQVKFPAHYAQTIAVAATDHASSIANYSLRGEAIDVSAPGGSRLAERVLSTNTTTFQPLPLDDDNDEGAEGEGGEGGSTQGAGLYGWGSGTSQAAAHVAGVVALLLEVHPGLTPEEVRMILIETAVDLGASTPAQGAGRIDAARAVERAKALAQ